MADNQDEDDDFQELGMHIAFYIIRIKIIDKDETF